MSNQASIACDLSAINENELEDHRKNGQVVFEAIQEIREVENGYRFKLPADTDIIQKTGAFISRERLCCPFFEFTLNIQADYKPVWLKLEGREGVKSYIKESLLPQLDITVTH